MNKIFKAAAVAAIIAFAGVNVFNANQDAKLSDLQMENVEALASPEPGWGKVAYEVAKWVAGAVGAYYEYQSEFGASNGIIGYSDVYLIHEDGRDVYKKEVRCDALAGVNECKPGQLHGYITVG